jgi:PAS domain S-box-containing protein
MTQTHIAPVPGETGSGHVVPWRVVPFALAVTAATLGLRIALDGPLGGQPVLVIFMLPIMLSAYVGRLPGGLAAAAFSYLLSSYFLLPPLYSFEVASGPQRWQLGLLALAGVSLSVLTGAMQDARHAADASGAELQRSRAEEREHASQLLVEQARLVAAQAVAQMGSWETDLSTLDVTWSEETHRIFETDPAIFKPTRAAFLALVHPDDRALVDDAFAGSVGETRSHIFEHRILLSGGRIKFVEECWRSVTDDAGRPVRAIGTCQDITERRSSEQALRESDEKFRQLADNISDVFWIRSPDMRELHYVSPAFERIWGRSVASLYANPQESSDFILPDDRERVAKAFATLIGDTRSLDIAYRIERPDGEIRSVRVRAFQVRDAQDRLIRHAGIATDITERQRLDEALETSESRFRALVNWSPSALAVQRNGTLLFVNPAAVTMMRAGSAQDLVGRSIVELVHSDVRRIQVNPADGRAEHEGAIPLFEVTLRRLDGTTIDVEVQGTSLLYDGEQAILGSLRDVTDRNRAADALRASVEELTLVELESSRINRALQTMSGCSEALIRAGHEQELLEQVCRIAVEVGGYRMAWVGYAQDDAARSIMPMAHAGVEDGYLSEYGVSWDEHTELGQGPAGEVIRTGTVVVSEDYAAEQSGAPWIGPARRRDYHGVIRLPLRDLGRTFGLLGLYSGELNQASAEEVALLQGMADSIAFGIGQLRARAEQQRVQTAVVKVAAGVSALAGAAFFEQLARSMADTLGAHAAFVSELLPGVPATARTIAAVVNGALVDDIEYVVAGTPCEALLTVDTCVVAEGVREQFPEVPTLAALHAQGYVGRRLDSSSGQPLGLLFVIFQQPLRHIELVTSTIQIFAARAASELERRQTDAQMREQAALLDIAHDAILVKDMDNRIIFWNKGAERTFGWTSAEAMGRNSVELLYEDSSGIPMAEAALLAHGAWEGEVIKRTKDGRRIDLLVHWTLVLDERGAPKSILAINTDITERKKLEAQFLRAQRTEGIGTLASGIAHDLNNVLTPILMSVEMLKEVVSGEDDLAMLATLQGSALRGAELVRQVLAFARGVEGRRIAVNLDQLVGDLGKVMSETLPKSIAIRCHAARDLWSVTGDPTQMYQVLLNLCVNARDAMPAGGALTITLSNELLDASCSTMNPDARPGPYVRIKVEDTGSGIPPQIRDRIFEPFFTTKGVGDGTGLGLSTTAAIVRSHGGCIQVESEEGKGTTFSIFFVADSATPTTGNAKKDADRRPVGAGQLILVVDDEPAICAIARRILERNGYRVLLAANGAEAVALFRRHRGAISAVLTDMAMPVMDGTATIVAIRAMDPEARIIGSSGLATAATVATIGKGQSGPAVRFVTKPYTAEALLQVLHAALDDPDEGSRPHGRSRVVA